MAKLEAIIRPQVTALFGKTKPDKVDEMVRKCVAEAEEHGMAEPAVMISLGGLTISDLAVPEPVLVDNFDLKAEQARLEAIGEKLLTVAEYSALAALMYKDLNKPIPWQEDVRIRPSMFLDKSSPTKERGPSEK